jgi:alpha-beta hydrolase superfamily lysophospholipase
VPDSEPRAVVGLLHGGAEHSGRCAHTAQRLTAAGFEVDAFDQRSHGASERVHGPGLQIERFDASSTTPSVDRLEARSGLA